MSNSDDNNPSPGKRVRDEVNRALERKSPLQIVGTINAMCAMLAKEAGFRAIYLSGAGVANASYGLPDLGMTSLADVLEDVRRITAACDLPLLVDVDTGFGSALSIERTTREMIRAGAAGMHLEDQVSAKRCGHRPGKELVACEEMCDRVAAAAGSRTDQSFVIMARTDAVAGEGLSSAIKRSNTYVAAGADMIFAEAITSVADYQTFTSEVSAPILANMTEFGKSPLLSTAELGDVGIAMALYPLSAFRAMNFAARKVFEEIAGTGTQQAMLNQMQTREELYETLGYHEAERRIDALTGSKSREDICDK